MNNFYKEVYDKIIAPNDDIKDKYIVIDVIGYIGKNINGTIFEYGNWRIKRFYGFVMIEWESIIGNAYLNFELYHHNYHGMYIIRFTQKNRFSSPQTIINKQDMEESIGSMMQSFIKTNSTLFFIERLLGQTSVMLDKIKSIIS